MSKNYSLDSSEKILNYGVTEFRFINKQIDIYSLAKLQSNNKCNRKV